jgi:hypothetical protein
MPLLLYRLLFPIAFLAAWPFYALRLWRRERGRRGHEKPKGYRIGLGERFGRYALELRARLAECAAPYWICSISVGETLLALKLARALRAREPAARVVLSVTTTTGYELLLREAEKAPWLVPIYNPVDFRFAVRRAIAAVKPLRAGADRRRDLAEPFIRRAEAWRAGGAGERADVAAERAALAEVSAHGTGGVGFVRFGVRAGDGRRAEVRRDRRVGGAVAPHGEHQV